MNGVTVNAVLHVISTGTGTGAAQLRRKVGQRQPHASHAVPRVPPPGAYGLDSPSAPFQALIPPLQARTAPRFTPLLYK